MNTKNIALMLSETLEHYSADKVRQGHYWCSFKQKGCFIGCLTHSDTAQGVTELFGIERDLVLLLEDIYEGLSPAESKQFFKDIPYAIGKDGRDLGFVKWAFLRDTLKALPAQEEKIKSVIDPVIEGMELLSAGIAWPHAYAASVAASGEAYAAAYNSTSASASASTAAYASASYSSYASSYSSSYSSSAASSAASAAAYSAADLPVRRGISSLDAAAAANSYFRAWPHADAGLERTRQAKSILALIKAA
mgnify:CR=1 FL=1